MHRHALPVAACLVSAALLAGACGVYDRTDDFERREDNYGTAEAQRTPLQPLDQRQPDNRSGRAKRAHTGQPVRDKLFISEQAGYEVARIEGIDSSFVVIENNNAYVAVVPNNTATGIFTNGSMDEDVDNTGTSEGVYDARTGSSYSKSGWLATPTNNYYTTTGNERLSAKALQTIGAVVREVHPSVMQVYISSNRDFVNGINMLMKAYWSGRPLEPHLDSFHRLLEQTFSESQQGKSH